MYKRDSAQGPIFVHKKRERERVESSTRCNRTSMLPTRLPTIVSCFLRTTFLSQVRACAGGRNRACRMYVCIEREATMPQKKRGEQRSGGVDEIFIDTVAAHHPFPQHCAAYLPSVRPRNA